MVYAVKDLVHVLEDEVLVVISEALGYLPPHCRILFFDKFLIFTVAKKPAAIDSMVAVAVDIDNNKKSPVVAVIHYLDNALQPFCVYFEAVAVVNFVKIGNRYAHCAEACVRNSVYHFL